MRRLILVFITLFIAGTAFSIQGKTTFNQLPKHEYFKWDLFVNIPANSVPKKTRVIIELSGQFIFTEHDFGFQHENARGNCMPIVNDMPISVDWHDSTRVDMLQFDPRDPGYGITVKCKIIDKKEKVETRKVLLTNGQSQQFYYTEEKESFFTVTFNSRIE